MNTVHHENIATLSQVVLALPKWENRVLFIGGAIIGFYLEEYLHGKLRTTLDVDLVIEVASHLKFYPLAEELRQAGFMELPERITRWKFKGLLLDILHPDMGESESSKKCFQEAFDFSIKQKIGVNSSISIPTLIHFIALKFQAFENRGNGDFLAKDMEDIVTVLDGCPEYLLKNLQLSAEQSRWIALKLNEMISNRDFLNVFSGHLATNTPSRVQRFKTRITQCLLQLEKSNV